MPTVLQTTEWVAIIIGLIAVVFLLVVCTILKRAIPYLGSPRILKPTNMECTETNIFLFSLCMLLSVYRQSRNSSDKAGTSIVRLVVEGIRGICCEILTKDRIFWVCMFLKPMVVFFKPETVQAVLTSSTVTDKSVHYDMVHCWLGTGVFTSPSEKWRKRRKLLNPTFHISILENFIPVFHEQSRVFVSKLQALTGEPWVDIVPLTNLCTLDIICQTVMGIKIHAQRNGNKEYVKAVHELTRAVLQRALRPWLYPDFIYYRSAEGKQFRSNLQCVQGLTKKVIKEKKKEMLERGASKPEAECTEDTQSPKPKRKALLEFLLEYHFKDPSFTEEDIREEVDTFTFAGHDTTGMGISWFLYCIGLYPEIQKKIFEELDEIFENDTEREVTRNDLPKMKYLECCIKETFRLYPPGPFFMRECTENFEFLGHTVYRGSCLLILPYALHRDKESFPDPEKFIPERFFPENSKGRHPYAYIPFSAGPRNCIGQKFGMMELKIIAANVLRRLKVTSLDPRDKVLVIPNITLQNADPLRLRFEMR